MERRYPLTKMPMPAPTPTTILTLARAYADAQVKLANCYDPWDERLWKGHRDMAGCIKRARQLMGGLHVEDKGVEMRENAAAAIREQMAQRTERDPLSLRGHLNESAAVALTLYKARLLKLIEREESHLLEASESKDQLRAIERLLRGLDPQGSLALDEENEEDGEGEDEPEDEE